jgi:hypothetical protein
MTDEPFKAGPYVVHYSIPVISGFMNLLEAWAGHETDFEIYSPREKLSQAFASAGVKARFLGTDNVGVANCDLQNEGQLLMLEKRGFRPEPGHCGLFEIG